MISKDVKFNEKGEWDWKVDNGKKYDFLQILDNKKERYNDHKKIVAPPQSFMNLTSLFFFF